MCDIRINVLLQTSAVVGTLHIAVYSVYLTEKIFRIHFKDHSVNVAVYCDSHIKQKYLLCGQNTGILKVTKSGSHNYLSAYL
jgi:hypothetical protein